MPIPVVGQGLAGSVPMGKEFHYPFTVTWKNLSCKQVIHLVMASRRAKDTQKVEGPEKMQGLTCGVQGTWISRQAHQGAHADSGLQGQGQHPQAETQGLLAGHMQAS